MGRVQPLDIQDCNCLDFMGTDGTGIDFHSCLFYIHGSQLSMTIFLMQQSATY